ncbi:hypothetical protein CIB93_04515 [Streptomyces sp. WZ.A104]|uniref:hypothetical protein n=1 Tax=unclassified Streptomyces TaxID=2593676 RepID=UPI000BBBC69B|nr:hypothetical protein [Streptomyces sp. WZ.A104]PCG87116.1 hypothetical protein CIB93_04515 [Streptomyces sp. WZ.A104]
MKPSRTGGGVALLGAAISAVIASSPAQAAEGEAETRHGIFMVHSESSVRDGTAQGDATFNSTAKPGPAPTTEPTTGSTTQPTTDPGTTPGAARVPATPSGVAVGAETTGWVRAETVLLVGGLSAAGAAAGLGLAARRRIMRRNN